MEDIPVSTHQQAWRYILLPAVYNPGDLENHEDTESTQATGKDARQNRTRTTHVSSLSISLSLSLSLLSRFLILGHTSGGDRDEGRYENATALERMDTRIYIFVRTSPSITAQTRRVESPAHA